MLKVKIKLFIKNNRYLKNIKFKKLNNKKRIRLRKVKKKKKQIKQIKKLLKS